MDLETGLTAKPAINSEGATKPERRAGPVVAPAVAGGFLKEVAARARKTLAAGTVVGRYEIVRLVGEGGMGTVYEALDARLGRRVALKVLSAELKSKRKAAKRFAIEAQAAARLDHPNVVRIFDFDMSGDLPYMAMEFLAGETLGAAIARGPLPFARMADLMLGVCAGVHAAHGKGIVHRDLKPSNIFLCPDWQGRELARVLDFGISKVGGISGSGLTETGDIVGTSQYLSPEQAAGARHVNEASDQYSLGVVMYECMTGQTPQQGLPIHELLRNVTQGRHPSPHHLRPDMPPALDAVIERAMSVRPKDRFPSVHALGRALFPFASPEGQRPFDDYYHAPPYPSWPARSRRSSTRKAEAAATALEPADAPADSWQGKMTRTSQRARRTPAAPKPAASPDTAPLVTQGLRSRSPTARSLYSIALGLALAGLVLGILFFVLMS